MKTIRELRGDYNLFPQEVSSQLKYLMKQKLDFDVFLPTRGMNLQRNLVWSLFQKRELIWSMILERHIPHFSVVNAMDDTWQIIDRKQRITTMFDFVNGKFTIEIEGKEYLYSELPDDYQRAISYFHFRYYRILEERTPLSDDAKIAWFERINFAGTAQDKEHMNKLIQTSKL